MKFLSNIDEQTLYDLEFQQVREWLEAYAAQPTAKSRLLGLKPVADREQLLADLGKVNELKTIREQGEPFPAIDFQELQKELRFLPIKNAVLEQEGFVRISIASELVNRIIYALDKREEVYPSLAALVQHVYYTTELLDAIAKVFDRKGKIKDDASPTLFEIRQKMQTLRNQINRNFERELRRLGKDGVLADTREAFVNERRVLAIVSTHKRKIGGSVLGSSKTGSLTFIEPEVNIPLNNELEMCIDDERKEIYKILQALTAEMAVHLPLITAYQELLVELDFINAKVKLAIELNAVLPGISDELVIELIDAYHPILWKNNKTQGKKTFPQRLSMDKFSRILVISGPNAGGKSITLKTLGLLQVMLQSGLLVPVHQNSKMSIFQSILSDIGDNQSIENELSTYSYRLKRMRYFLQVANRRSLLLLDEFGTGSDPDLGGALAEVFFEELYNKKCYGVITTHYANIKLKADQLRNAVNGCMLFNTETLEPLYKFSMGQPGSSFTFEVAQINGIPMELIAAAKDKISDQKVKMDRLLSELQKEKNYLERLNKEHIEAQELAQKAKLNYDSKRVQLEQKLKTQQDLLEKNNKFVQLGTRLASFIQQYNVRSRKKDVNAPLLEEVRKLLAVEKTKLDAAEQKAKNASALPSKTKKKKERPPEQDPHQRHRIVIGSKVRLIETKQSGTVEEIQGNTLTVTFGFLRMKVEREKLSWLG